ncbi:proline/glycine betaine ABC transporter permease [Yaniella sp.]|uniref:ABC transporter permease n=1 Tax=Yaniella sp. TaxID=2773929 RepID=UPI00264721B0|nr:ABC transporter permease subunit [Yaniella sp.]MDN5815420.1 ABC transporter permease subunit [Yaniella sp.]
MEIPVPRIPLGDWIEVILDWLLATLGGFFTVIRNFLEDLYELLLWVLMTPEWWIITIVLAGLGWWLRSWQLALGTVIGFILIVGVNQWENAMSTLSLVTIATLIAVVIAIPLGILGAKSYTASKILRPVMDFMQTMPPMVYLIPALVIFRVGVVPGMVATVIFAMAPGVRFTELGIRGVDSEVVEAGKAVGSTPGKILRQIQLPLAMPTIMAGVNQVIMLSLSMVVIAGMVGAGGLGGEVVASLNRINAGLGFESGLAVVILAMYLDRLTSIQAKT